VLWTDRQQAYLRRDGADDKLAPSADTLLVDINLDPLPNSPALQATELLTDAQLNQQFRTPRDLHNAGRGVGRRRTPRRTPHGW
jgi:hypothetical protein